MWERVISPFLLPKPTLVLQALDPADLLCTASGPWRLLHAKTTELCFHVYFHFPSFPKPHQAAPAYSPPPALCTLAHLTQKNHGCSLQRNSSSEWHCASSLGFAVASPVPALSTALACNALGVPCSRPVAQDCRCHLSSSNREFAYVLPVILLLLGVFPEEKETLSSLF